jgi:toxin ParE1/3/4
MTRHARAELREAFDYYEARRRGLGRRFSVAAATAIETVREAPHRWPLIEDGIRKYRLRKFPYAILYEVEGDIVIVSAVMHLKREPSYWKDQS